MRRHRIVQLDYPAIRIADRVYTLLDRLRVAQLRLASIALVVMMGVTLADVFLRYVFNSPIRGAYELVEAMMVVFVFNGMSTAFLQRRNIVIDLIDSFAPRPCRRRADPPVGRADDYHARPVRLRDAQAGAAGV